MDGVQSPQYFFVVEPPTSDVTRILSQIDSGDPSAADQLLPLVYDELRKLAAARLAQEQPGLTLQATALVHDAYLRLVDVERAQHWNSRGHFFSAAAEAMRRIVIDQARRRGRLKREGKRQRVDLDSACSIEEPLSLDILALDEALAKLTIMDPAKADLVKLRYFAGLSEEEAAGALEVSRATASRYWTFARAWLIQAIEEENQ